MRKNNLHSHSLEDTFKWGVEFGKSLSPGAIIALKGDLGAGKTTLMKAIAHGILGIDPREVTSPTFTYLHIYQDLVYHFDLYRLRSEEDFLAMGFDEHFNPTAICCIEWPERIKSLLPKKTIEITLTHKGETQREILVSEEN